MSDNRDEETGQFTPEEPIVGREATEIASGYVPYKPEPEEDPADIKVAAWAREKLKSYENSTPTSDIKTYGIDLPDNVTMTVEQAAKTLTDIRKAEADQAELDHDEAIRKAVDERRGVKPEVEAEPAIDVEKVLANPKIKSAIEQQISEAETIKQTYSAAIESADQLQSAAFIARFPELASQPAEQWQNVLSAMQPDRAREAISTLQHIVQVKTALQQQQTQRAEAERVRFKAASESFEEKIKDVPKARRTEIENEIVAALQERNSDLGGVAKFLHGIEGSGEAMALLWELGEARSQLKALRNAPKAVATRHLPPVQKPGVAGAVRAHASATSMATLEQQLSGATGTQALKIAAKLTSLKRQANGG